MSQDAAPEITRKSLIFPMCACILLVVMPFINFTPNLDDLTPKEQARQLYPLNLRWADIVQAALGAAAATLAFFSRRGFEAGMAKRGQHSNASTSSWIEDVFLGGLTGLAVFLGLRGLSPAGIWGLSLTMFVLVYPTFKGIVQAWPRR